MWVESPVAGVLLALRVCAVVLAFRGGPSHHFLFLIMICMRAFSIHIWRSLSMICITTALVEMRESVLFIGTQFSNRYTAVDTPAREHKSSTSRNLQIHRCFAL
jgi:hypothetical protein